MYQLPGFRFRPIDPGDWPGELTRRRQPSPFSAKWTTTLDDLERELWQLGAADKVAQVALGEGAIRQDGMPRADARPDHPGVLLSFEARRGGKGRLRFACDTFTRFEDNVRAIALGLESLRRVERYRLAGDRAQYRGFQAIEPPKPRLTREDAADRLLDAASVVGIGMLRSTLRDDPTARALAWRKIATHFHPDAGGDRDAWALLEEAKALLDGTLTGAGRELGGR
jgi:hypothetical protein